MKLKQFFFLACVLVIPMNLFAKAGPLIPLPAVSISEAITIASEYFYSKEDRPRIIDERYFKKSDYILISAQYTNRFQETEEKEWAWRIKFVHPAQNDHTAEYKVTNDKQIIFLNASE